MKNTKLESARAAKKLTQEQMATKAAVSLRAYKAYESGDRIPRADVAIRIARAVGRSVEWLFGADQRR